MTTAYTIRWSAPRIYCCDWLSRDDRPRTTPLPTATNATYASRLAPPEAWRSNIAGRAARTHLAKYQPCCDAASVGRSTSSAQRRMAPSKKCISCLGTRCYYSCNRAARAAQSHRRRSQHGRTVERAQHELHDAYCRCKRRSGLTSAHHLQKPRSVGHVTEIGPQFPVLQGVANAVGMFDSGRSSAAAVALSALPLIPTRLGETS